MRKISNDFYQGDQTKLIYLEIFEDLASNLKKSVPISIYFNPFPSLPSVTTGDREQFQCHMVASNNKTRPLFLEFN